jgi:acetoin utilization protein AcuC
MTQGRLAEEHVETVGVVYGPALSCYDFGDDHPLQPSRHRLAIELLESLGWLQKPSVLLEEPEMATTTQLLTVHTYPYIQAVQHAQAIARGIRPAADLTLYGLGTEDNPIFDAIHDAPALCAGAALHAMNMILDERAVHTYSPSGGMHHAMRASASGFCVYNDCAVAIKAAIDGGHRVAYVDLDAHHGDGVQSIFYDDPRVLTISVHESGEYLFPGTGSEDEIGSGEAAGSCLNVPLPPFAGDEAILEALVRVVEPAVRRFRPTILVTQTGCDTHHDDPLTDLAATLSLYPQLADRLHSLSHEVCEGRWLILGGGGYDPADVTPRAWTAFIGSVLGEDTTDVGLSDSWIDSSRAAGGQPPSLLLADTALEVQPLSRTRIAPLLEEIERTALANIRPGRSAI